MVRPASFGELLRRARLAAGLTQAELAERAGLSLRGVSDLERGARQRPHPRTVEMLAAALPLSAAERGALETAARRPVMPAAARVAPPLPSPMTSFVGRARELDTLIDLLPATRLLTLTGAGGVGKTRLALEVARTAWAEYPDGVWLADLAALADPALVPSVVARVLGVVEQADRSPTETLAAWLATRRALLVLDNCEHLVAACADLAAALLPVCPGLRVLASSRERLGVAGEVAWRVPSLGLPPADGRTEPDDLLASDAGRLFVERARAVERRFALTPEDAPAVAEICRRLDGIPLAIELAATRAAVLSVTQIAARLDDCFHLLTSDARTAVPRHRTLRAAIDWSHALLSDAEQALLRRLAVFAGGFTLAGAEAVGAGAPGSEGGGEGERVSPVGRALTPSPPPFLSVLELLARLVDKSLVQVDEGTGGEKRYRLLETVRQYALERLRAAGEVEAMRARHGDWYLALAERAEPAAFTRAQVAWLVWLDVEHDNLQAALAWSLEQAPDAGLRLAAALWPFWRLRGRHREGRRWLESLLRAGAAGAPGPAAVRAKALAGAGMMAYVQGDLAAARRWLERSLALSRAIGEERLAAQGLRELGGLLALLGERAAAWTLLEEALALSRSSGDEHGLGTALQIAGWLAVREGDYRSARSLLTEAVAVLRPVGDRLPLAFALYELARVEQGEGAAARAEALLDEGLTLAQELGAPWQVALIRVELGNLALRRGDLPRAAAHYEAGVRLGRQLGDHSLPTSLIALGRVALLQGDARRATALLDESLALFSRQADRQGIGDALHALGLAALHDGDAMTAAERLRGSLRLRQELGERLGVAAGLSALATLAARRRPAAAARLLGAADALQRTLGVPVAHSDAPGHPGTLPVVRAALGEAAFAAAWAEGQAMTLDQAVTYALADAPERSA